MLVCIIPSIINCRSILFRSLICSILLIPCTIATGQFTWTNWFFGDNSSTVGFTFNNEFGDPLLNNNRRAVDLTESNLMLTNTAIIILYSNGESVFNNIGDEMPNGRNLNGSPSSLYGCAISDHPNFCNQYYLFTSEPEENPSPRGVYYSVVDLNIAVEGFLTFGLGDVIPSQKNIKITPDGFDSAESIYVIKKNYPKEGSWLLLSERNTGKIHIYNISTQGVNLHKVYRMDELIPSASGQIIQNIIFKHYDIDADNSILLLATKRDGASNNSTIASFNFDKIAGEINTNSLTTITQSSKYVYGTEFSPDGSKLYYSDHLDNTLYQYDYKTATNTLLGTSNHNGKSGGLKLGPNHRIYWANKYNVEPNNDPISTISVLYAPDQPGLSCDLRIDDYLMDAFILPQRIGVFPTVERTNIDPFILLANDAECGQENGSAQILASQSILPLTVMWDNGETSLLATNLSAGLHKVEITTLDFCTFKDSIFIPELSDFLVSDLEINTADPTDCILADGSISLKSSSFLQDSIYRIMFINDRNETFEISETVLSNSEITLSDLAVGRYFDFEISSSYTICSHTFMDTINLFGISQKPSLGNDTTICQNGILSISSLTDFKSYDWSTGATSKNLDVSQSGEYILQVTDDNGCENKDTISVTVIGDFDLSLSPEQIIESGDSIQLMPDLNESETIVYNWTPPEQLSCENCPSPYASPTNTTRYTLIVTDENICIDSSSTEIKVNKYSGIFVPNIFTPNDDGENDLLGVVSGSEDINFIKSFQIYNRWGELVFARENFLITEQGNKWTGKVSNKPANEGVYIYLIYMEMLNGDTQTKSGDFLLIR